MTHGYVAVGHGTEPNGVFDPGAVAGTVKEYDLAYQVVDRLTGLLHPYCDFETEVSGGPGHDPDYRGSVSRVNASGASWAIEVHFDYSGAPRGGFGLYVSDAGREWADLVMSQTKAQGLATRSNTRRTDLYFLNATKPPAIIWECDRVGNDITTEELDKIAIGIAEGTKMWLASRGMLTGGISTPPVPPPPAQPVKPAPRPPAKPYPGYLMQLQTPWMKTNDVRIVQDKLHSLGYGIGVDGVFGPQTDGIVRDYQRDRGLAIDGVVGPQTWGALFS